MAPPSLAQLRAEFPSLRTQAHLNTGGAGPLPARVADAVKAAVDLDIAMARSSDAGEQLRQERRTALRAAVARLLHAAPGDIALTTGVTAALNAAILGIDWREGDEAITTDHEHPAVLAPLQLVAERFGVRVHTLSLPYGDEPLEPLVAALAGPRTRLVALSHVSWSSGATLDVAGAARAAAACDALTLVDGAQSAGVIPARPVALGVDAYAVNAVKWLLGPAGLGALWVSPRAHARLRPTVVGAGSGVAAGGGMRWHGDARRFEVGSLPEVLMPGWLAALALHAELGEEWIAARVAAIVAVARQRLDGKVARILTPASSRSGLLTFEPHGDAAAVVAVLESQGVIVRDVPHLGAIRAALGWFTIPDEVDRLVGGLPGIPG